MKSNQKSQLPCFYGTLNLVTLKQFLDLVPSTFTSSVGNTVRCMNPLTIPCSSKENVPEETYKEVLVDLYATGYNKKQKVDLMRYLILDQANLVDISNKDLGNSLYDACDELAYNYGTPTHLVRISSRLWGIFNPKDFSMLYNESGKMGLLVKNPKLNVVYSIHRGEPKTFRMLGQN